MNRTLKAIAALMLMMVFAMGCNKEGVYKGHTYVDLGLPSGNLWATCNIGAETPEDVGCYFAWGETETKNDFTSDNYRFYDENYNVTKYSNEDSLNLLQPEDDAANVNWGNGWHMPTQEDWYELVSNTAQMWIVRNGVYGRLYSSTNGKEIFFPAVVHPSLSGIHRIQGNYWTNFGSQMMALCFSINSEWSGIDVSERSEGLFVRPVRSSK